MDNCEVKGSSIHHKGLYATRDIAKGERIIDYIGEKINKEESDRRLKEQERRYFENPQDEAGTYMFEISEDVCIDGDVPDNDAKYANHSCSPNCEFEVDGERIWIQAIKDLKKGEEITVDYGFSLDDETVKHPCRCGSANCVGYIVGEEDRPRLKEHFQKETLKNNG